MPYEVKTPISQAMEEGVITRKELKSLMVRSNNPAFVRLFFWICMLILTSSLIYFSYDTWLLIPSMFVQGVVIVHHFSLQHECCHYTAFKTRKLNDFFGHLCGFSIMLPNQHFRYEHCDHHTYTQLKGKDPELIELPISVYKYIWYISAFPYWKNKFSEIYRHILGRLSDEEKKFIPKLEQKTIFREARIMVSLYSLLILGSFYLNFWGLFWYWWLPVILGEPVMRAIRLTEHVGRPNTDDLKENTRSSIVSIPMKFLCWNMNYHAEHHYASSIPFHAL
ncbi:MAG: fatty acid desaturase, partial [Paracoccaceae bacterium]